MECDIKKGSLFISHFEAIKQIPDAAERDAIYEAIFNYQFYGTIPEKLPTMAKSIFAIAKDQLERGSNG